MKVAIPYWQGRVSPVFDVAENVLVVEIGDGVELSRSEVAFDAENPQVRAACLAQTGADLLICGAISRELEMSLSAAGVEVISQTCGYIEQVLQAFAQGQLDQNAFLMPGCGCRRRRCHRGRRRGGR